MKKFFEFRVLVPSSHGASFREVKAYITDAVVSMDGALEPPNPQNNFEGDPCWGIGGKITVKEIRNREKPEPVLYQARKKSLTDIGGLWFDIPKKQYKIDPLRYDYRKLYEA